MQPRITELIKALLDENEIAVAERLGFLIEREKEKWKAWALLEQILPIFWIVEGKYLHTRAPVFVYRTLYYLNHPHAYIDDSRNMIMMMGNHLEGLLAHLLGLRNRPLGNLSNYLSRINRTELASYLLKFNEVYVRAKHMTGDPFLPARLDQRTFSARETVYCLFITRHLSIKLFSLLKEAGKPLSEEWKPIDPKWFAWDSEEPVGPGRGGIAKSQQPEV